MLEVSGGATLTYLPTAGCPQISSPASNIRPLCMVGKKRKKMGKHDRPPAHALVDLAHFGEGLRNARLLLVFFTVRHSFGGGPPWLPSSFVTLGRVDTFINFHPSTQYSRGLMLLI